MAILIGTATTFAQQNDGAAEKLAELKEDRELLLEEIVKDEEFRTLLIEFTGEHPQAPLVQRILDRLREIREKRIEAYSLLGKVKDAVTELEMGQEYSQISLEESEIVPILVDLEKFKIKIEQDFDTLERELRNP